LRKLKDLKVKAKILFRIQKIENDEHFGDCEPVGNGIRELKSTTLKDTESILKNQTEKSLFFLLEVISQPIKETLKRQKRY
jgi:putative component of toxin-antitoxin plasmid stabilization module